ncbi:kinase-like protein, partial [Glonium stellatum]
GSYTDEKHVGLLMSPVADHNLSDYLDIIQINKATQNMMATFFGCLAGALTKLHYSYHIRHKDIKPKNILIKDGNILLTDFGMALDWNESGQTTTNQEQRKSPKYCAPETTEGESRNSKADIWSLGCVYLEIVTVLKGQSRRNMKEFFISNGSRSEFFRLNQDAVVG